MELSKKSGLKMSHKKLEGRDIEVGKKVYRVGKFKEITQAGSKIDGFKVFKRGNFVYETYKARVKRVA